MTRHRLFGIPAVLALLGIFMLAFTACPGGSDTPPRFTASEGTITGEGSITIAPDTAVVAGTIITLTATADDADYQFSSWATSPAVTLTPNATAASVTFVMPESDVTVDAVFTRIGVYNAIVRGDVVGEGAFDILPYPYDSVAPNTNVTLTATATLGAGYEFGTWVINPPVPDLVVTANPLTFAMPGNDITVGVIFVPEEQELPTFEITKGKNVGEGGFTIDPYPHNEIEVGTPITLTADPGTGYMFVNWVIDPPVSLSPGATYATASFTMPSNDVTVHAVFEPHAHNDLVIHRDGPRPGLRVIPIYENPFWHTMGTTQFEPGTPIQDWDTYFELNAVISDGPNGSTAAIRAPNVHPADGHFGFALALAEGETIDLTEVMALSLYMRISEGTHAGRTFGFGNIGTPYSNWNGGHRGPIFAGNENNGVVPLTTEWQRVIVPVPYGVTAPEAINRVFTFTALQWRGRYIYIAEMEFLTEGIELEGLRITGDVEVSLPVNPLDATVNVATFFPGRIAQEFSMVDDGSIHRLFTTTVRAHIIGNQDALEGWDMGSLNRFRVASSNVTEGDADDLVITENGTIVGATGALVAYLTLESEAGLPLLNPPVIRVEFANLDYMSLGDFYGLTGNLNAHTAAHGYWQASWWAAFHPAGYVVAPTLDRPAIFFVRGASFSGMGRNYQSWDLSGFDYITFLVQTGIHTNPRYNAVGQTYRFFLQGPGPGAPNEFGAVGYDFLITDAFEEGWVEITIPLVATNFANEDGEHPDLTNLAGWRFHMLHPPVDTDFTHPTIWVADIYARRDTGGN